eukprot:2154569-Alexandrium_andersonii.AAC.1
MHACATKHARVCERALRGFQPSSRCASCVHALIRTLSSLAMIAQALLARSRTHLASLIVH